MYIIYNLNKKKFYLYSVDDANSQEQSEDTYDSYEEKVYKDKIKEKLKKVKEFTQENCSQIFNVIPFIGEGILKNLEGNNKKLSELSVELSLRLDLELGVIVAKAGIGADFKVQMIWKNLDSI